VRASEKTIVSGKTIVRLLLLCGVVASVLYVATDVLASMLWPAYSYTSQSVSQLLAIGTPTRSFVFPLMTAYNVLVIAFGVGVLASAASRRSLRVAGILLVAYGIVSFMGLALFPLHLGQTEASSGAAGHVAITGLIVLLMLLYMGFGAAGLGNAFRLYTIVTVVAVVLAGGYAGSQVSALAETGSSPWLGVIERVNIYLSLLWVAVFAVALLRRERRLVTAE